MVPNIFVFQHDKDPKHTSKMVQKWLTSQPFLLFLVAWSITKLESHGTFLGSLEMVFERLFYTLRGIKELCKRVCNVYFNFNEKNFIVLYESMLWSISVVVAERPVEKILKFGKSRVNNTKYIFVCSC